MFVFASAVLSHLARTCYMAFWQLFRVPAALGPRVKLHKLYFHTYRMELGSAATTKTCWRCSPAHKHTAFCRDGIMQNVTAYRMCIHRNFSRFQVHWMIRTGETIKWLRMQAIKQKTTRHSPSLKGIWSDQNRAYVPIVGRHSHTHQDTHANSSKGPYRNERNYVMWVTNKAISLSVTCLECGTFTRISPKSTWSTWRAAETLQRLPCSIRLIIAAIIRQTNSHIQ